MTLTVRPQLFFHKIQPGQSIVRGKVYPSDDYWPYMGDTIIIRETDPIVGYTPPLLSIPKQA